MCKPNFLWSHALSQSIKKIFLQKWKQKMRDRSNSKQADVWDFIWYDYHIIYIQFDALKSNLENAFLVRKWDDHTWKHELYNSWYIQNHDRDLSNESGSNEVEFVPQEHKNESRSLVGVIEDAFGRARALSLFLDSLSVASASSSSSHNIFFFVE